MEVQEFADGRFGQVRRCFAEMAGRRKAPARRSPRMGLAPIPADSDPPPP